MSLKCVQHVFYTQGFSTNNPMSLLEGYSFSNYLLALQGPQACQWLDRALKELRCGVISQKWAMPAVNRFSIKKICHLPLLPDSNGLLPFVSQLLRDGFDKLWLILFRKTWGRLRPDKGSGLLYSYLQSAVGTLTQDSPPRSAGSAPCQACFGAFCFGVSCGQPLTGLQTSSVYKN